MQTYRPSLPPDSVPQELRDWLVQEFQNIQKAANAGSDSLPLRYLTQAPARPQDGWIYQADGTAWNPGSGRGAYRFTAPSTYTFLG